MAAAPLHASLGCRWYQRTGAGIGKLHFNTRCRLVSSDLALLLCPFCLFPALQRAALETPPSLLSPSNAGSSSGLTATLFMISNASKGNFSGNIVHFSLSSMSSSMVYLILSSSALPMGRSSFWTSGAKIKSGYKRWHELHNRQSAMSKLKLQLQLLLPCPFSPSLRPFQSLQTGWIPSPSRLQAAGSRLRQERRRRRLRRRCHRQGGTRVAQSFPRKSWGLQESCIAPPCTPAGRRQSIQRNRKDMMRGGMDQWRAANKANMHTYT